MKLGHNILVGFANSIWSALVAFATVPFYLKYLGIEAYGVIGFFTTTQVILSLLDFGLAPAINREVARSYAAGDMKEARNLVHTLTVVYWSVGFMIALMGLGLSSVLAEHWLRASKLDVETLKHAIVVMGLVVACRWPNGLYQGVLMGMQKMAVTSIINMFMVTLTSVGAVLVLANISPTLEAFFLWQIFVASIYVTIMRHYAWQSIGNDGLERFNLIRLKRIWRFSAGMSGVAISGVILMQLDKVLLSKILSLEDFGRYALAGVVSSALYILLTPLFNAIYPRMSAIVATGDTEELSYLYRNGSRLFLSIFFPIAIIGVTFSGDILYLWTRNQELAMQTGPIVSLILIGTALNGVMHFPYALQLAYGVTNLPLKINGVLIVIMTPLTILLASKFGAIGGAASWAILNAIYLLVGTQMTHKKLLNGLGRQWLVCDVIYPLAVSVVVVGLGSSIVHKLELQALINLILGAVLVFISFGLMMKLSPSTWYFTLNDLFNKSNIKSSKV